MSFQELLENRAKEKMLDNLLDYLGYDGVAFFQMCFDEFDSLIEAVWNEGGLPHSVHFREGMQIRNWMRGHKYFQDRHYGDHDFDNNWMRFIRKALQQCHGKQKRKEE